MFTNLCSSFQTVFHVYCLIYRYKCCFHVQEYNLNGVAETQAMITSALKSQYNNGSTSIQTTDVLVSHIGESKSMPHTCGAAGF